MVTGKLEPADLNVFHAYSAHDHTRGGANGKGLNIP